MKIGIYSKKKYIVMIKQEFQIFETHYSLVSFREINVYKQVYDEYLTMYKLRGSKWKKTEAIE